MKSIFDAVAISGLEIKNRIAAASVGRNLADLDGHIPESLYDIYKELAEGGAGLIISEMTMVSVHDYPVPGFTRLQDDAVIPEYKKLQTWFIRQMLSWWHSLPMVDISGTEHRSLLMK